MPSPAPESASEDMDTEISDLSSKERHRQQLRKTHGDIPEVDQFINLYSRMKEGPIKAGEMLIMQELMYFFYPNEANERGIEAIRRLVDQAGADTLVYPAPSSLPPDDGSQ